MSAPAEKPLFTDEFRMRDDTRGPDLDAPDGAPGVKRFWGKYQGVVKNPIDPEGRCRIFVSVEDVYGPNITSWALPALPYAGISTGMYIVPPVGANVWVEFLHGHPDYPIWTGFWWGERAHAPMTPAAAVPGAPQLTIESLLKHAIVISDTPLPPYLPFGGVLIKSGETARIAIDAKGVRLFGALVQMNGTPDGLSPMTAALAVFGP